MVREAIVAGMFYPAEEEKLKEEIEKNLEETEKTEEKVIAIITPHAGYKFSGKTQAKAYKQIEKADTYIILGTAHTGYPTAAILLEEFKTPLGKIEVDEEFGKSLINKGTVKYNHLVHDKEHSIEVQLPYLQIIDPKAKIVPIVCGEDTDHEKLGKAINQTAKQQEKKIIIICSTDFTHYGINYAYMPFNTNVKENMEELDKGAIKWIAKLDAWSFLDYIKEKKATICGAKAIATTIIAAKEQGATKGKLLEYKTSGEVTEDWTNVVGYAAITINS